MESIEKRVAHALELHRKGYNCAQCVACSFAEDFGISEKTAFIMSEAFGLGMGSMNTCGAVTGMALVTGMKYSDGNLEMPGSKKTCYAEMREMSSEFKSKVGSLNCAEIRGKAGHSEGKVLRSCDGCIEDAVRIVAERLL